MLRIRRFIGKRGSIKLGATEYVGFAMLIVALDPKYDLVDGGEWISHRYEGLKDVVQGFKIGLPALIKFGIERLSKCFKHYDGLLIADLKLADIGDIMSSTAKMLKSFGFNAVIAHSFVGYSQGIDVLARVCKEEGVKLILVVSMSHEGSQEFIDKHVDELLEVARKAESWGLVAPATRPQIIRHIRSRMGFSIKILSPGVGVQGAEPGDALCAGADYEIVGRTITHAPDVRGAALKILESQRRKVLECRGSR